MARILALHLIYSFIWLQGQRVEIVILLFWVTRGLTDMLQLQVLFKL